MTIKDVYILIPGTHENVRLHVKRKLGPQDWKRSVFTSIPKKGLKQQEFILTALAAGSKKIKVMAGWFPSEDSKESVPCLSPRFW